ncbi:uncharacterized protein [Chelonus insularis]|uniref:uncharacterized protein n=1 Tax=Chelonus insularis TaxID=460826 RepID=UPI00158F534F|nr:uncharacterized protein LOC118073236 [Chelonus insularis]
MLITFLLFTLFTVGRSQLWDSDYNLDIPIYNTNDNISTNSVQYYGMNYVFDQIEELGQGCNRFVDLSQPEESLEQIKNNTARIVHELEAESTKLTEMRLNTKKNFDKQKYNVRNIRFFIDNAKRTLFYLHVLVDVGLEQIKKNPPKSISEMKISISDLESRLNRLPLNMNEVMANVSELRKIRENAPTNINQLHEQIRPLETLENDALKNICKLMKEAYKLVEIQTNITKDLSEMNTSVLKLWEIAHDADINAEELRSMIWMLEMTHQYSSIDIDRVMRNALMFGKTKKDAEKIIAEFKKKVSNSERV